MRQQTSTLNDLGLYIHIPFCKKKCPYCAFYKEIWKQQDENSFIDSLIQDLRSYQKFSPKFSTIFLGGGTPTILNHNSLKKLFKEIHNTSQINPDCEITIEANPESISTNLLDTLAECGVNRISIGIQSFIQAELDFLGRWHSLDTIHSALQLIRSHKKNWNLNIDLIFSLPQSTLKSLEFNIQNALQYTPQHLSTYGLTIEPQTIFEKRKINPLPDSLELEQFEFIIDICSKNKFQHYEISAFAKPGHTCKHNLIYWTFKDFIGIGPSASSFFQNHRFTQVSDIAAYINNPLSPFIQNQSTEVSIHDQIIEYIIAFLRLDSGISKSDFYTKFNIEFEIFFKEKLDVLIQKELLENTKTHIKKTKKGLFLLNEILITFI